MKKRGSLEDFLDRFDGFEKERATGIAPVSTAWMAAVFAIDT